jgi:hypothetical protein
VVGTHAAVLSDDILSKNYMEWQEVRFARRFCAVKRLVARADTGTNAAVVQEMIVQLSWFTKAKKWLEIRVW